MDKTARFVVSRSMPKYAEVTRSKPKYAEVTRSNAK